jgi:nucleoside-diphosphate-sugar epimerase
MKILLTGATGFLGSALARRWVHAGHDVTAIVRSASAEKLKSLDIGDLVAAAYSSDADVEEIVQASAPDVIVNTACSYGRSGESLSQMLDANVRFGVLLLQSQLKGAGVGRFINTGTVLEPSTNLYALSKWQMTDWGESVVKVFPNQIQFINVLLQHMYGPHDAATKFTTHVLRSCRSNMSRLDLTAGEQLRDFIYIDDVVDAYDILVNSFEKLAPFEHIEVGSGVAPSIRTFVETAHRVTGSTTELVFGAIPYRANEAMSCCADTTRMREFGWAPAFDIEAGLRKTLNLESPT